MTLKEAFFGRIYRKGTYIAMIVMIAHQITGIGAILLYSNTIFGLIPGGGLNSRQATYVIGGWNFVASACSLYSGKRFSRRFLLIGGNFAMAGSLYIFSTLVILNYPTTALIFMLIFLFCF